MMSGWVELRTTTATMKADKENRVEELVLEEQEEEGRWNGSELILKLRLITTPVNETSSKTPLEL